mgnify:CR=1 FL=1
MDRIFKRVLVPSDFKGSRLDKAAATLFPDFSRSRLKTWIESGTLTLGGMKAEPKTRLGGGEELVLDAQLDSVIPVESENIPLTVVHQDKSILVIDKPPGLVVHPGAGNPSGTLQNALLNLDASLSTLPRAGIVHRLDKDTSGLLLIARTMGVRNRLVAELERREIQRRYEGVCEAGKLVYAVSESRLTPRTRARRIELCEPREIIGPQSPTILVVHAGRLVSAARHVVDVRPGIHKRLRVGPGLAAQLEHATAKSTQERPVVRDEDHGALEVTERVDQHLFGRQVQVVGRLVEHQKVGRMQKHAREHKPRAFPARERSDGLVRFVAGKLKRPEKRPVVPRVRVVPARLPQLSPQQLACESAERGLQRPAGLGVGMRESPRRPAE